MVLGRAIVWAWFVVMVGAALIVANVTPPMSGGTLAAVVLVLLGSAPLARMIQVANKGGKR